MSDLTRRKKELSNSYNNLCSCYGDIISEQTKTINQLKELLHSLKCCLTSENIEPQTRVEKSLAKIDNATGEK